MFSRLPRCANSRNGVTWHVLTAAIAASLIAACSPETTQPVAANTAEAFERAIPAAPKSGYHYQSVEEQTLQDDTFGNPGNLWVDQGRELFESGNTSTACDSCHSGIPATESGDKPFTNSWRSAAARYPAYDQTLKRVLTLEQRINQCRTRYQDQKAFEWESPELLALTTFVARQSKGIPINVVQTSLNQQSLARGAAYYHQRKGQLNLACRHCHEQNPGKMLRGDRLSEGLPTGYPAYKLEWQTLGSLQRRLRDCDIGVRAEPHAFGAQIYADLELYLKVRAQGLPIDAPAVRR